MNKIIGILSVLMILIIVLFTIPSCAQEGISSEEYNRVINELSEARNQITTLQKKLAEVEIMEEAKYEQLNKESEDLKKQIDARVSEITVMKEEYMELSKEFEELKSQNSINLGEIENLQAQYEELKQQYDEVTEPPGEIVEEDIEQMLFELINQERINNNEDELLWGINIFKVAQTNNRRMEKSKTYEYHELHAIQEVFWATGYDTAESIANAALVVWKNNPYRYQQNMLNKAATYGAVDAYKSGDIIYITYIAGIFR